MSSTLSNVQYLDRHVAEYNPSPSESIYFGKYPYKIKLKSPVVKKVPGVPFNRSLSSVSSNLREELKDALYHGNITDARIVCSSSNNNYAVYFANYQQFVEILTIFGNAVSECFGPVDSTHWEMLNDNNYNIEVRKKYWYNHYDTKLSILVMISHFAPREHQEYKKEIREYVTELFEDVRMSGTYWSCDLFVRYDEFIELLPFIKLKFDKIKVKYTRCVLKR